MAQQDSVAEVLRGLRRQGFVLEPAGSGDDYAVRSKGVDNVAHRPVLTLPAARPGSAVGGHGHWLWASVVVPTALGTRNG